MTRRTFALSAAASALSAAASPAAAASRKFTLAFTPGSIGIQTDQRGAIELAAKYGYESVQPFSGDLSGLSGTALRELNAELLERNLQWASAGLPVDFRNDAEKFREGMEALRAAAPVYEKAGVDRISTWLMPMHQDLTYLQYFRQTAARLREVAKVCQDSGMRFGLEYVGTPSLRISKRHQFVHTMAETKELIAEIGMPNVGFVLDSWHWWTAEESAADIETLSNSDVVSADLNDAPAGIAKPAQHDTTRELPLATGIIPVREFLQALVKIGYDGPVRPEPFNKRLNALGAEPAAQEASAAMKKAFALVV